MSAPASLLLRRLAEGRVHASLSALATIAAVRAKLAAEEEEMEGFAARVPRCEKAVALFREHLLQQRRQKAMQGELVLRKRRLEVGAARAGRGLWSRHSFSPPPSTLL